MAANRKTLCVAVATLALSRMATATFGLRHSASARAESRHDLPVYNAAGDLLVPSDYREWIFLSSGLDMVYGPKAAASQAHSSFDNVFAPAAAYRSFLASGTWPDKTMLVLEIRAADTNPSINHGGHSQGGVTGMEVHVKDSSRFSSGWAFFDVNDGKGKYIPETASCYSCHREHGAADTTFVQFYPTLFPVAKSKGTLSQAYLKEFGSR